MDLNQNFKIAIHDIFRNKFISGEIPQKYEIIKYDQDLKIYHLRNIATNVVSKHSPEQVQIFFIKETSF